MSASSVSVVIPARDSEPYLGEAIESALGEAADEVLVLTRPDGDAATTAEALGARVVRADELGANSRRNLGAEAAAGPVIAFLDADDRFTAGRMTAMTEALGDAATGLVRQFVSPDRAEELAGRIRLDPTPRPGMVAGAFAVKREAFLALGGFRESLATGEVADWLGRAREAGLELGKVDRVVVERRIHGGQHLSREHASELRASYLRLAREGVLRSRGS